MTFSEKVTLKKVFLLPITGLCPSQESQRWTSYRRGKRCKRCRKYIAIIGIEVVVVRGGVMQVPVLNVIMFLLVIYYLNKIVVCL